MSKLFFAQLKRINEKLYVEKVYDLLKSKGKLVGLLFNREFEDDHPPFGATKELYTNLFENHFSFKIFENCKNSLNSRKDHEIFIEFEKK